GLPPLMTCPPGPCAAAGKATAITMAARTERRDSRLMASSGGVTVWLTAAIAAQLGIALQLRRLQQRDGRQMVLQMGGAQPRLRVADRGGRRGDRVGRCRAAGEQRVQCPLLRDQLLADGNRLGLHRLEETLDAASLVVRQAKLG